MGFRCAKCGKHIENEVLQRVTVKTHAETHVKCMKGRSRHNPIPINAPRIVTAKGYVAPNGV